MNEFYQRGLGWDWKTCRAQAGTPKSATGRARHPGWLGLGVKMRDRDEKEKERRWAREAAGRADFIKGLEYQAKGLGLYQG